MSNLTNEYLEIIQEENLNEFVGLAAIALLAIYKKFLSKAARACRSSDPVDRATCRVKYQIDGRRAQLQKIQSAESQCSKSKNPEKCQQQLHRQAQNINNKIQKLLVKYKSTSKKAKMKKLKKEPI